MAKNIETKKDEVKFTTSDPKEMLNNYLSKRVLKTWVEDFVDPDTGEVVPIERNEILFNAGKLIDNDLQAEIMFHISAGEITEVEVSNQKREAFLNHYNGLVPYMVTAQINGKNRKFLLYASSVIMAHEVANDYIELNYCGGFYISQIKEFNSCIIVEESKLKPLIEIHPGIKITNPIEEEQQDVVKEYYKIEAIITLDEEREYTQMFVIKAKDVDAAKDVINDWIRQNLDKDKQNEKIEKLKSMFLLSDESLNSLTDFTITIKSATIFPCSCTIDKEFSMAYMESNNA